MTTSRGHLDDLLQAWGETQRLSDDQVEAVRRAIVGPPATLPATWWSDFAAQVASTIVEANEHANRAAHTMAFSTAA